MLRVAILADDLTGALDSAEPFARHGASVSVGTSLEAARAISFAGCQVAAVNLDSRQMQPEDAARAAQQAWEYIAPWRPDCLFKKVDSRMKGNVVAELSAMWGMGGRTAAIVAPAIPSLGRVVSGGAIVGFGVGEPISITGLSGWKKEWEVPDCGGEAAMAAIAGRILAQRSSTIAVGASGLAEALADTLQRDTTANGAVAPPFAAGTRRMIMAIGSRDPITLEQIAVLQRSHIPRTMISGEDAIPSGMADSDLILLRPSSSGQPPEAVADELAARTLAVAQQERISAILLSGGDTAAAFIRLAGIELLSPLGRIAQGIPISRGQSAQGAFTLITKSGGFGSPRALIDAFTRWRAMAQPQEPYHRRVASIPAIGRGE